MVVISFVCLPLKGNSNHRSSCESVIAPTSWGDPAPWAPEWPQFPAGLGVQTTS